VPPKRSKSAVRPSTDAMIVSFQRR